MPPIIETFVRWKEGGKKRWLWVAATMQAVVFLIHPRRNIEALNLLLGDLYGFFQSDRWSVYLEHLPSHRHQLCWAHLKRNWEKKAERSKAAKRLAERWLALHETIFALWHRFKNGEFDREGLMVRMRPSMAALVALHAEGSRSRDGVLARFCERLGAADERHWLFVFEEGVEPTNNQAERVQRRAVLWRRRSFGCRSAEGCRFVERLLTVVETLKLQKRNVLDYLEQAITAHRQKQPCPPRNGERLPFSYIRIRNLFEVFAMNTKSKSDSHSNAPTNSSEIKQHLSMIEHLRLMSIITTSRTKEWLEFDSVVFRFAMGALGTSVGMSLYHLGFEKLGYGMLTKIHRSAPFTFFRNTIERIFQNNQTRQDDHTIPFKLQSIYNSYIQSLSKNCSTVKFIDNPERLLGALAIVVKSPSDNEKGVIIISYYHAFTLFSRLFDIEVIARQYHIVLEPSWSGLCNIDLLNYTRYSFPVFVQAYEPHDRAFIQRLSSNLIAVPIAINWWVDHRTFHMFDDKKKDIDALMIASWATFKRHNRFFEGIRRLRNRGRKISVALLGYPVELTKEDVLRQAKYYGIADQIKLYESIPPHEVNAFLNRSKVNVLWSRREGENRAMIEGMFAGVPCLIRAGFNYGYDYPYVNSQTGCFASEAELPDKLAWMIDNYQNFSSRDWVMHNMSCIVATAKLSNVIRDYSMSQGQVWTRDLVPKVNCLNSMAYYNPEDAQQFEEDYLFLRSAIRE